MPTIEIASINSIGIDLNQDDFDFAVIEENKLISHRGLFYNFLKEQTGVIVHIGNPDLKFRKTEGCYAGMLIDWNFEPQETESTYSEPKAYVVASEDTRKFKFLDLYKSDIDRLLNIAMENSPVKKAYFLTDYQFGPARGSIEIAQTIEAFWREHNHDGLKFNAIYELYAR